MEHPLLGSLGLWPPFWRSTLVLREASSPQREEESLLGSLGLWRVQGLEASGVEASSPQQLSSRLPRLLPVLVESPVPLSLFACPVVLLLYGLPPLLEAFLVLEGLGGEGGLALFLGSLAFFGLHELEQDPLWLPVAVLAQKQHRGRLVVVGGPRHSV